MTFIHSSIDYQLVVSIITINEGRNIQRVNSVHEAKAKNMVLNGASAKRALHGQQIYMPQKLNLGFHEPI